LKAIILCAGFGKRMKPFTDEYQKAMLPINGKPILEFIIEGIKRAGIDDFILVIGYRKEQIMDYFQDGHDWDIKIEYIEQKDLNGTGEAVLLCETLIDNSVFFLTWGDTLVSYEVYRKVVELYRNEKPDFIMVGNLVDDPYKGAAIYINNQNCSEIIEKPLKGTSSTNVNNAGIFILSKKIFYVLKNQKKSARGEIEIPESIRYGIKNLDWQVRVFKMSKDHFYGDFGDLIEYEKLKDSKKWLKLL
jgi:NDP-sugar pyrophosphorylase family protein